MRIFRFDAATGHPITAFGSVNAAISPILRGADPIQIACMRIGPGGVIGAHPAVGPQLFLVVGGEGWVRVVGRRLVRPLLPHCLRRTGRCRSASGKTGTPPGVPAPRRSMSFHARAPSNTPHVRFRIWKTCGRGSARRCLTTRRSPHHAHRGARE
jgi:hypothetical protein